MQRVLRLIPRFLVTRVTTLRLWGFPVSRVNRVDLDEASAAAQPPHPPVSRKAYNTGSGGGEASAFSGQDRYPLLYVCSLAFC